MRIKCGSIIRLRQVQKVAILRHKHEDEPVDESQERIEVVWWRELALGELITQFGVFGMGEEPLPQQAERRLDAVAQLITRAGTCLARFFAPALQRTVGGGAGGISAENICFLYIRR